MSTNRNRPVHEIKQGLIKATVWKNQTKVGLRHHVKVARVFKDGDVWRESQQFGRDDLLKLANILTQCHEWIYANDNDDARSPADVQENFHHARK